MCTKMKKFNAYLYIFFIPIISSCFGQTSHEIEINFKGKTDSIIFLAHYYGSTFKIIDTLKTVNNKIIIQNDQSIPEGVYTLAGRNKSKYFDFIIRKNSSFKINVGTKNFIDSINVIGSKENEYFFKYYQLNAQLYKLAHSQNTEEITLKREKLIREIEALRKNIFSNLPNSLFSKILLTFEEPQIPKELTSRTDQYQYYKKNFWNNTDLSHSNILRTPVFQKRLDYFFDKVVLPHPDTLIQEIDKFLNKEMDDEIFKQVLWDLTLKYEHPKIMGLDKVFVHLAENYYQNNNRIDISESIINNITNRAEKTKKTLIGETAKNLIMVDSSGNFIDLYKNINKKYTLLLFWDSDCQTCQKEIRELKELYKSQDFEFDVFAVGTEHDLPPWKKYIKEHNLSWINVNGTRSVTEDYHDLYNIYSTPTIYVLDQEKKIIAKNLKVNQIKDFLKGYESNIIRTIK